MPKTSRVQFLLSERELSRLDKWMFENEIRGRSQALRCLILNRCGPDKMLFGNGYPEDLEKDQAEMKKVIQNALDQDFSIWVDFLRIAKVLRIPDIDACHNYMSEESFLKIWKLVKEWKTDLNCFIIRFGTNIQSLSPNEGSLKFAAYKGVIFFRDYEE
ncbi:hypothetical protein JK182_09555 [Acetobacter okinawensis]|uniref:hypothetical protein n=1 Tax=Acetobacter okinawensis TaxID=1076594 RepID=UPI001BA53245|nr:hypothetical protein [Acetobacter okinawensis]MBS0988906.1 hypothetical protein [Acetobacter okinawensis]